MEEILQCPRCVDLAAAEGRAILATDFQLIMNAETTDWNCHNGHIVKAAEIEAIMTGKDVPAPAPRKLTLAEKRAVRQSANAQAREENTPPKQAENEVAEVPVSGNDLVIPKFDSEAEEAAWWHEHQEEVAKDFVKAAQEGRLGHGTVSRRAGDDPDDEDDEVERAIDQITDLMATAGDSFDAVNPDDSAGNHPSMFTEGFLLKNGNLVLAVEIPEMYVGAAETLAAENNQSVREWAQQRMEFYLESEFAMVKTV